MPDRRSSNFKVVESFSRLQAVHARHKKASSTSWLWLEQTLHVKRGKARGAARRRPARPSCGLHAFEMLNAPPAPRDHDE